MMLNDPALKKELRAEISIHPLEQIPAGSVLVARRILPSSCSAAYGRSALRRH